MKIIKINYLTYIFLGILFLSGLIKDGIIIFIIVFAHEMGHVLVSKILKYEIENVTIYPFGGITKLYKEINVPLKNDFLLAIAGFLAQLILLIVINLINLNTHTYNTFIEYNTLIFLFNLLPIYPLDGFFILETLLNKIFSFKKSYNLSTILSILILITFILVFAKVNANYLVMTSFLIYKIVDRYKTRNLILNKFYLERYLKTIKYHKIINSKNSDLSLLKRDKYFYFWDKNRWSSEKKVLKNKYKN